MSSCPERTQLTTTLLASMMLFGCGAVQDDTLQSSTSALTATNACVDGCVLRGIEEARCAEACAAIGGERCETWCLERGGNIAECREACASRGRADCYDSCIARGGDDATCREACTRDAAEACTDGDEAERDGVLYICKNGAWSPAPGPV